MSEPIKVLTSVITSTPDRLALLDSLSDKVRARQAHIDRIPIPTHKLKKTGSNESIRPSSPNGDADLEVHSAPQNDHLAHPIHPQQQLLSSRKRKTTSVLSSESLPSKYRSRSMIVVYYDSEIQSAFESTVREIGTARNALRRARMAARMEAVALGEATTLENRNGYATLSMLRSARGPGPRPDAIADGDRDGVALVDAALEKAQSLCEKGAHQFLREGECEGEISGAREAFNEARTIAEREVAKLREEEKLRRERDKDTAKADEKGMGASTDAIEVDDDVDGSDYDEEEFKMPTFRSTRMMARG